MVDSTADYDAGACASPTVRELFLSFSGIAILGFGGVMPWARRMLVEQRRWLTEEEFAEALALSQFLPGGNILNLSVVVGQRYRGVAGAFAAALGLIAAPMLIVSCLGLLYRHYGDLQVVRDCLAGVTAGAAGLIAAMAAKMAQPLLRRRVVWPVAVVVLAFVAIALAQLSLLPVLAVLVPLSVALAWWRSG